MGEISVHIYLRQYIFLTQMKIRHQVGGLMQERRNSIANALKLRLSCTNLSRMELRLSCTNLSR